jgi:phosphate acetyltransferase
MAGPRRHEKYDALIYACHALAPVRTAVAHPCDEASLRGAVGASPLGLFFASGPLILTFA